MTDAPTPREKLATALDINFGVIEVLHALTENPHLDPRILQILTLAKRSLITADRFGHEAYQSWPGKNP